MGLLPLAPVRQNFGIPQRANERGPDIVLSLGLDSRG